MTESKSQGQVAILYGKMKAALFPIFQDVSELRDHSYFFMHAFLAASGQWSDTVSPAEGTDGSISSPSVHKQKDLHVSNVCLIV